MRRLLLLPLMLFSIGLAHAQISGGIYSISHSVQSGGGGNAESTQYKTVGTAGQTVAADVITTPPFTLRSGFWNPLFAPTAAGANIGGRVLKMNGSPLKNAVLYLSGGALTMPRISRSNAFGYFNFEDVEVGYFYTLTVSHKQYGFGAPSQYFTLTDNVTDIVFQTSWEN